MLNTTLLPKFGDHPDGKNTTAALELYKQATELGSSDAQHTLALFHKYGLHGLEHSEAKVTTTLDFFWTFTNVSRSVVSIIRSIALSLSLTVPLAFSFLFQAVLLDTFAADGGHTGAQLVLANRLNDGVGVAKGCHKAAYYFNLVADTG